jgi:hypothetical protein
MGAFEGLHQLPIKHLGFDRLGGHHRTNWAIHRVIYVANPIINITFWAGVPSSLFIGEW